jgi:hypothetical protein
MKQPSELLPLARLRFFFHLLSKGTSFPAECFLNGKVVIAAERGILSVGDERIMTYTKSLKEDWKKFDLLDLPTQVAKVFSFQKNIFSQCSMFGRSVFARVAGKGAIIEFLQPPKIAVFPELSGMIHLFATDGSLTKTPQKTFRGTFSVVDAFQNFCVTKREFTEKTSSTYLELLALHNLFSALAKKDLRDCTVILIVDSLSAIKLTLGLDVRGDFFEILREIDGFRKTLFEKNVKDFFIHVRSHRNVFVKLNSEADMYAGVFSFMEGGHSEPEKCPPECTGSSLCQPCQWNHRVNEFLRGIQPTLLQLCIW